MSRRQEECHEGHQGQHDRGRPRRDPYQSPVGEGIEKRDAEQAVDDGEEKLTTTGPRQAQRQRDDDEEGRSQAKSKTRGPEWGELTDADANGEDVDPSRGSRLWRT